MNVVDSFMCLKIKVAAEKPLCRTQTIQRLHVYLFWLALLSKGHRAENEVELFKSWVCVFLFSNRYACTQFLISGNHCLILFTFLAVSYVVV